MLEETAATSVVAVAADAADLIRKARAQPDLVVTDIQMPPDSTDDGMRAAKQIREELPDVGVLVLSVPRGALRARPRRRPGRRRRVPAQGPRRRPHGLPRRDPPRRRGGSALDPEVVQRMVGRQRQDSPLDELTPREREVVSLMAEGRSNQGIADELIVTVAAVERHVTNIFAKLGSAPRPRTIGACSPCCSTSSARISTQAIRIGFGQPIHQRLSGVLWRGSGGIMLRSWRRMRRFGCGRAGRSGSPATIPPDHPARWAFD